MSGDPAAGLVRVHVGIGSNLGDRRATIESACTAMRSLAADAGLVCSPLYESAPLGPPDQPDYLNAVCTFETALSPGTLLAELQRIEREAGRVRPARRWSARTLDLDLLLYGACTIATDDLRVPHPGIAERAFVLCPLRDLDATLEIPGAGGVRKLLGAVDTTGIRRLATNASAGMGVERG